jgi:hypothetical protein
MFVINIRTIETMSEITRKKRKNRHYYNVMVVKALATKHEVTMDFVRQAIRGDRNSDRAQLITKEYTAKCKEVQELLKK